MRSLSLIFVAALCGLGQAQHGHGIHIPEIDRYVHQILNKFSSYTHYSGPSYKNPSWHPKPTNTHYPHASHNVSCSDYWMENIKHQGVAAFNPSPDTYKVFRNVKDYGAVGDGVTDDTAAIQRAISDGARCEPGVCASTTTTPAVIYFPAGTYLTTTSIVDYYYTQIIGNAICPPTIRAASNWTGGFGMIDGDRYGANGLGWASVNVFFRQIRNLVFDMTAVPFNSSMTGIHWPTSQATSLQNVVFNMSDAPGTQHQGLFMEEGSSGFLNDLYFYGGLYAINHGNQQFTYRNINIFNTVTAINQLWDWGWTYKSINIKNCSVGLNMSSLTNGAQSVGSVTFIDSSFTDTDIAIVTARDSTSTPASGGSLILENVRLNNVSVAIEGPGNTVLLEGSEGLSVISGWGQGHSYTPEGPTTFQGQIQPDARPASLLQNDGKYYERSKPQYEKLRLSSFISARDFGATGNGVTDDTAALQEAIIVAAASNKVLYVDHGDYVVTRTLYIPGGSRIVGETYSVILSQGSFFNDMKNPRPVVQVGKPGERGAIEWSDMIVSTQGAQAGAILIQFNLASRGTPSGMWDVHVRVGGFAGSEQQVGNCPTTPTVATPPAAIDPDCIVAFMSMHITKYASGLYQENNWIWVADHDIEDPLLTRITIYAGRGLLIESKGPVWLVGTGVEHHVMYQYQLVAASNIWMGQIQTETAYYQPNPDAHVPFPRVAALHDPYFPGSTISNSTYGNSTTTNSTNASGGWGLRIVDSAALVYGAGLYSFFSNYNTSCSDQGNGETCQTRIFSVEGNSDVNLYNLNTVGATNMITIDGRDIAKYSDNLNGFVDTIALFRY